MDYVGATCKGIEVCLTLLADRVVTEILYLGLNFGLKIYRTTHLHSNRPKYYNILPVIRHRLTAFFQLQQYCTTDMSKAVTVRVITTPRNEYSQR